MQISRLSEKSEVLDRVFNEMKKEASTSILHRINFGIKKEDPFEEHAKGDIWFLFQGKLLRDNKKIILKEESNDS